MRLSSGSPEPQRELQIKRSPQYQDRIFSNLLLHAILGRRGRYEYHQQWPRYLLLERIAFAITKISPTVYQDINDEE